MKKRIAVNAIQPRVIKSAVSVSKTYQATKMLTYSLLITDVDGGSSFSSQPMEVIMSV